MLQIRHPLSRRRVEDDLFERSIDTGHETARFRWNRVGPMFTTEIGQHRVDQDGDGLNIFATKRNGLPRWISNSTSNAISIPAKPSNRTVRPRRPKGGGLRLGARVSGEFEDRFASA